MEQAASGLHAVDVPGLQRVGQLGQLRRRQIVQLDVEVRQRIKNLQEGTSAWEVEYARAMEQIKRKHGIDS